MTPSSPFISATRLPNGHEIETDVCIIGSGAAGITVARQLIGSRLRVTLLEAGGFKHNRAMNADAHRLVHTGLPFDNPIPSRGRVYGGSTTLWFGRCTRPTELDLERSSWVAHSGWPISFDELEPWLDVATDILAVRNADKLKIDNWSANPTTDAFRRNGTTNVDVFLWAGALDLGAAARNDFELAPNVQIVTDATCVQIHADEIDTVRHASFVSSDSRTLRVKASSFVVAAGGLENPRLLLASNGTRPAGLGNQYDNVGRYYQDHVRGDGLARIDVRAMNDQRLAVLSLLHERADTPHGHAQLRVVFDDDLQRSEGLLNHGLHGYLVSDLEQARGFKNYASVRAQLRRGFVHSGSTFLRELGAVVGSSPQLARLAVRRRIGRNRPSTFIVIDQLAQEPDPESRVTLRPNDLDHTGLPRLQVDWRLRDSTLRSHRRLHEVFFDALAQAGITTGVSQLLDDPSFEPHYLDMKHPSGTTRMSASPRHGVVDANCLVHGTRNLYVSGSSTFPTNGHFNPTLTIVALAARLAQHLERTAT